jgi:hypothetical protein
VVPRRLLHEIDRPGGNFFVNRLHAFCGQRASVFTLLFADFTEARIDGLIVRIRREAVQHTAWAEVSLEGRLL